MRIASIELSPYGHLTHAHLDLPAPSGGPGLHVLSGRNGAGKSTSLRALDGALFGIPRRTRDTHTHPGPALRVALVLETAEGRPLRVERRKRDGQSLFAPDGTPVDEAILREALGGLPPEEFRAMFLLDCAKLEEGSADLLAGRGLLGEALFGAALGLGRVHTVLAELDAEAEDVWVKGGSRTLNRQLKALGDARKDKREGRLNPEAWARLQRELEDTETELLGLRDSITQTAARIGRAERLERCLEPLTRRQRLLSELAELGKTAELPPTFVDEVRAAQRDRDDAERRLAEAQEELDHIDGELAVNPQPGAIVDREDAVNELYQRAGESAKAARDLPRRHSELLTRGQDVRRLGARVAALDAASDLESLRIRAADRARLEELAGEHAALTQAREAATEAVERLTRRAATHAEGEPQPPGLTAAAQTALAAAIDAAQAAGDLDGAAQTARDATRRNRQEAEIACAALPGWEGGLEALECLKVPSAATLARFAGERRELDRAADRLQQRAEELQRRERSLAAEADELAAGPTAPGRDEISRARQRRDELLDAAIHRSDDAPAHGSTVREHVRAADALSDARADHAEIAARRERLDREHAALKAADDRLRLDHDAHDARINAYAKRWLQAWPGLPSGPRCPDGMQEWLEARAAIMDSVGKGRDAEGSATDVEREIERRRRALTTACGELSRADIPPDASLAGPFQRSRRIHDEALASRLACDEHDRDRRRLEDDLGEANDRLTAAEAALVQWRTAWLPVVSALGLEGSATPGQARAQLQAIEDLIASHDAEQALEHRVAALEEDEQAFLQNARALATQLAPDLAGSEPSVIAETLHRRAATARSAKAARAQLEPRRRKVALQAAQDENALADAEDRVRALAERSSVATDELACLCTAIELRAVARADLRAVEIEIEAAGAASVADLAAELSDVTPETLTAQRGEGARDAAQLEERRSELERKAGSIREQLAAGGSETAAVAAEHEASARSAVIDSYERYWELQLAAAALRGAVERHRRQHQGPLLQRAGELFAKLSGGRMTGLTAVTAERQPYIMGVLPGGREVPVPDMSQGQRHQLFLALRLACLERHFEHNDPMPLILDDLLIQLDDVSARAALEILAELARVTQVVFFTHHDHLVTMARSTVPADLLVEREISETTRPALKAA
jgi:uncharacterized protein YhaN